MLDFDPTLKDVLAQAHNVLCLEALGGKERDNIQVLELTLEKSWAGERDRQSSHYLKYNAPIRPKIIMDRHIPVSKISEVHVLWGFASALGDLA